MIKTRRQQVLERERLDLLARDRRYLVYIAGLRSEDYVELENASKRLRRMIERESKKVLEQDWKELNEGE